jgi:NAD-dependent SIR2 family protein deacetylase
MNDPQVGCFYKCEKCGHVFNWNRTRRLPHGTTSQGVRVCPRCQTEYVRKFRESDLDAILAQIPDDAVLVEVPPCA